MYKNKSSLDSIAKQNFQKAVQYYDNQDYQRAFFYFQLAAQADFAEAQNNLGSMYASGLGIKQNIHEAAKLFHLAIDQHFEIALFNLRRLFNSNPSDPVIIYYAAISIKDEEMLNAFNQLLIRDPKIFHELTKNDSWENIQSLLKPQNHARAYQNRIFSLSDMADETTVKKTITCTLL